MDLIQMLEGVDREEQQNEYELVVYNNYNVLELSEIATGHHAESKHALFNQRDVYNHLCSHLLVFGRKNGKLVASTRLLSWERVCHLDLVGGFVSQGSFDLFGIARDLPQTLEVSGTFIDPEHKNTKVMIQMWKGVLAQVKKHRARYLMGVLGLNPNMMEHDVSMLLQDANTPLIDGADHQIFARFPAKESKAVEISAVTVNGFSIQQQLIAMQAELEHEANINYGSNCFELFVRVDVTQLNAT